MFFRSSNIDKNKHQSQRVKPQSLATRFKGLLNTLLVCTSFVTGTIIFIDSYHNLHKVQRKSTLQESYFAAATLEEYLDNLKGDLQRLSSQTGLLSLPKDHLRDILKGALDKNRALLAITILDRFGQVRFSVGAKQKNEDLRDNLAFQVPFFNHITFIGPVRYNETSKRKEMTYSIPTWDSQHQIDGVMITQFTLKYFDRILTSLGKQTDSYFYVLDSYQKIIALSSPPPPKSLGHLDEVISRNLNELHSIDKETPYRGLFGMKVLGARQKLSRFGWILIAEQPTDITKRVLLKRAFIVLAILGLSSLLISTYFSRRLIHNILSPLNHLLLGIREFQAHKKPFKALYLEEDEIGTLSKAFAELTFRLNDAMKSLQAAHDSIKKSKEKAEQATHAKSEFLAVMSHEIRTPLNAIIGLHSFLLQGELNPEQRKYAEIIKQNSDHLLTLINDILDFSRLDAGKMTVESQTYALRDVVEQSLDMVSLKADAKDLDLAYHVSPDVPIQVVGDPSHLRQVLLNLLSNAIKFTSDGQVSLLVRQIGEIEEGQKKSNVTLEFTVSDTGIGIEEEQISKLFSPFVQGDSSHTRIYGGTGLGLAISRKLVSLSGGKITAQKNISGGSDFIFTFQLGRSDDPKELQIPGKTRRIALFCSNPIRIAHIRSLSQSYQTEIKVFEKYEELADLSAAHLGTQGFDLHFIDVFFFLEHCHEFDTVMEKVFAPVSVPTVLIAPIKLQKKCLEEKKWSFAAMLTPIIKEKDFLNAINNMGTINSFSDSLIESPPTSTSGPGAVLSGLKTLRILLVEDNPVNQMVIQMQLNALGCQADMVANGQEALEAISQKDFDVILMDIHMPILDGYQTTQKIRHNVLISRQPYIIALTAAGQKDGEKENCMKAGMNDFITKPLSLEALRQSLIEAASYVAQQR